MNIRNRLKKLETETLPSAFCRCGNLPQVIIQTEQTDAPTLPETCETCGKVINRIEATFKINTN